MNEEQLSSPSYGPKQLALIVVVWLAASVAIAVTIFRTTRTGSSDPIWFALLLFGWAAITVRVAFILRQPHRVTLRGDIIRIYRWFGFTDVPLSRVRYVEHDFPGRGPRRVMLSLEPESPSDRVLKVVEFVPRGGELGLGGKDIADELRRRANEARAIHAAT